MVFREPILAGVFDADVLLERWRVFETDDGLRRLVGNHLHGYGCVSAALVHFNCKTLRAETLDGLSYQLFGKPGWFWDVVEIWDGWREVQGGMTKDVTAELLAGSGGEAGDVR
jgi:hypothetical protein